MQSRGSIILVILSAFVILLVSFWPKEETATDFVQSTGIFKPSLSQLAEVKAMAISTNHPMAQSVLPLSSPEAVAKVVRPDGKTELQAYRIAVRGGVLSIDGTQRIVGDFHQRRGPMPWMAGMWCVRLLNADLRVLAEDTANAPDDACVVLDPQNHDANGQPQATQFAGAGEEAMLQVRLPPHPDAKWLKVYRLAGSERADWNTEPSGKLLASIPLP